MTRGSATRVTRRSLLKTTMLGVGGLAIAALAGCQGAPAASPTATSAPKPAATTAPPAATQAPAAKPAETAAPQVTAKKGGKFIFVEASEPPTLDLQKTNVSTADVFGSHIIETLVWHNPESGAYEPFLATGWETTPDGLTWTFKLRQDVVFHDGTPLDAKAVKRSLERMVDPKTASLRAATLLGDKRLKSVEAADQYTVKLAYTQPFGPLLSGLANGFCGIISPAALDKYGDDIGNNPVGSGPFRFKEWVKGQGVVGVPFEKYNWAPKAWGRQGPPLVDEFRWRGIAENTTRIVALERDEAQMVRLPYPDYKRIKDAGYPIVQLNNPGTGQSIFMNVTKAPMDDKKVRLAVAYAVDRDAMIKAPFLGGATWPEYAPLTQGVLGYDPDLAKRVGVLFDLNKSKALLDEAGWKLGADGIRAKDGQKLVLSQVVNTGMKDQSEVLQALLKVVGIQVDIKTLDVAARLEATGKGEHHLTWNADTHNDPDILYLQFHSSAIGSLNFPHVNNKELDDLLDKGRTTVDLNQRKQIYQKVQEIVLSEAYIVPVYNSARVFALQKYVKGVMFNDRAGVVAYGVWLDK